MIKVDEKQTVVSGTIADLTAQLAFAIMKVGGSILQNSDDRGKAHFYEVMMLAFRVADSEITEEDAIDELNDKAEKTPFDDDDDDDEDDDHVPSDDEIDKMLDDLIGAILEKNRRDR